MKILIIGLFYPIVSGVSTANETVLKIGKNNKNFNFNKINMGNTNFKENIGNFSFEKLFNTTKKYIKLYKIFNCDVVYITPGQTFFGILKYLPIILFTKVLNKELIIHIHGDYVHQEYANLTGIKKKIYIWLFSSADKGIVLSKTLQRNYINFLPNKKIYTIVNFVNQELLESNLNKKDYSKIIFVFFSNLMKEKGILDFLQAIEILIKNNVNDFEVKIAGDIDKNLQSTIDMYLNKYNIIHYEGVISAKNKKIFLFATNVFVLPTYYKMEGQPISILEAMASGNYVITTQHAGIIDIFSEKNGAYVEIQNPNSLANAMKKCIKNRSMLKTIGKSNKQYIEDNFTEKKFLDSIVETFNDKGD